MYCPSTGSKIFWPGPNFLGLDQNILCRTKRWFMFSKLVFGPTQMSFWKGTKCNEIFGQAQTIWTGSFGPVEGQGIRAPQEHRAYKKKYFLLAEGGIWRLRNATKLILNESWVTSLIMWGKFSSHQSLQSYLFYKSRGVATGGSGGPQASLGICKISYTPGWNVWGECLFYEVNAPLLHVCYKP